MGVTVGFEAVRRAKHAVNEALYARNEKSKTQTVL